MSSGSYSLLPMKLCNAICLWKHLEQVVFPANHRLTKIPYFSKLVSSLKSAKECE